MIIFSIFSPSLILSELIVLWQGSESGCLNNSSLFTAPWGFIVICLGW